MLSYSVLTISHLFSYALACILFSRRPYSNYHLGISPLIGGFFIIQYTSFKSVLCWLKTELGVQNDLELRRAHRKSTMPVFSEQIVIFGVMIEHHQLDWILEITPVIYCTVGGATIGTPIALYV